MIAWMLAVTLALGQEPTVEPVPELPAEEVEQVVKRSGYFAPGPKPLWVGTGTPFTVPSKLHALGIFRPFTLGISDRTEFEHTGLLTFVAPSFRVKHTLWTSYLSKNSVQYGVAMTTRFGVPTGGLRLLQGSLLPSEAQIPFIGVVGVGLVSGLKAPHYAVGWGLEMRTAFKGGEFYLLPPGLPFVDPMLAPITEGPVLTARLMLDWIVTRKSDGMDVVVISLDTRLQVGGGGPDLNSRLFALFRLGNKTAIGAGGIIAYERQTDGLHFFAAPLMDFQLRI